ncbi:B12-binding domain-containing radical SAM protein [Aliirhizobium smilacinae]|uniref:Radical SAM protein n=1 Tax=Aliirhizobium smilacinae TaxID=1395944 RepID=A0A5C4X8Y7_9HYPH|nr:B12-binding domain-containing radical SAM protein [Rhizobium smilacinae]TNM59913.1 radical SAM protein [Rhizobium smilacinae]
MDFVTNRVQALEIGFCQFSNKLLSTSNSEISSKLYRKCYPNMPGYFFNEHLLELPYWINIVVGMVDDDCQKRLIIIEDVEKAIDEIRRRDFDFVFFSVMNVNESFVLDIVRQCPRTKFLLGGYTDSTKFSDCSNVVYFSSVFDIANVPGLPVDVTRPPDYSLFADGTLWMPRITLSTGCKHKCRFCAVPRVLSEIDDKGVMDQARALKGLNFHLIYLDDKTFGQASNYRLLAPVFEEVKKFNPEFLGFVIQTTATTLTMKGGRMLQEFMDELHVKYIEVGVETCDDDLLAELIKPHRLKHVLEVCEGIRAFNASKPGSSAARTHDDGRVGFIPNILFGIKGDTYEKTISFIRENRDIISTINFANISSYPGKRGDDFLPYEGPDDGDDYSFNKSWLDPEQVERGKRALETIMQDFGVEVRIR